MIKLALFDVDFTLTRKETLIAFFTYLVKKRPALLLHLPKAIGSGLFYKLGINKEKKTKEMFLAFLENVSMETIDKLSADFIEEELIHFLYDDGIEKVKELKSKGYTIVLTSASPEFYINKLKKVFDADYVMGTRFIEKDGRFASVMGGENNKGEEKVRRLFEVFDKDNIDFMDSYMFSDSMSDEPLLALVGKPYLINYKKKNPKYPVLYWR
jgi:HAD superfamily hydrolase (TIGR01490 family)